MEKSAHQLTLRSDNGAHVQLSVPMHDFNQEQSAAIQKLFDAGSPSALSEDEWDRIRDLRATTRGDFGQNALIVRFDWKWVRIDESGLTFDEAQKL